MECFFVYKIEDKKLESFIFVYKLYELSWGVVASALFIL